MIRYCLLPLCTYLFCAAFAVNLSAAVEAPLPWAQRQIGGLKWHTDYAAAYHEARRDGKMLLLWFRDHRHSAAADTYEDRVLASSQLREPLQPYVRAAISLDAELPGGSENDRGASSRLLDHTAFRHLHGRQGIAVIDLIDSGSDTYGYVVSAHPFRDGTYYSRRATQTVLGLPRGSITQRALVYAVRIHPESPASTNGRPSPILFEQARRHSKLMARIQQVGHHNWNTRFYTIAEAVGGGLVASEVAAVGSGNTMIRAAIDCVHAWRQSPGHWSSVSGRQLMYGYDLKRAGNGEWYATGLFANPD